MFNEINTNRIITLNTLLLKYKTILCNLNFEHFSITCGSMIKDISIHDDETVIHTLYNPPLCWSLQETFDGGIAYRPAADYITIESDDKFQVTSSTEEEMFAFSIIYSPSICRDLEVLVDLRCMNYDTAFASYVRDYSELDYYIAEIEEKINEYQ